MCEFSVKSRKRSILNHNCCFIYKNMTVVMTNVFVTLALITSLHK